MNFIWWDISQGNAFGNNLLKGQILIVESGAALLAQLSVESLPPVKKTATHVHTRKNFVKFFFWGHLIVHAHRGHTQRYLAPIGQFFVEFCPHAGIGFGSLVRQNCEAKGEDRSSFQFSKACVNLSLVALSNGEGWRVEGCRRSTTRTRRPSGRGDGGQ